MGSIPSFACCLPPRTETVAASADLLQDLVGDIEVRVGMLHVVVILQRVHQPEDLLGVFALNAHGGLRHHRDVGGLDREAGLLQSLLHDEELLRGGHDFVDLTG